uniref:Uncharacterized protein n=1 Tax=viral metagenome TaxID=1070528 RepID=A0A6C0KNS4_9ZZZZ
MSNFQNSILNNSMNILYSLSFYAPIIICVSIFMFSMFTNTITKAGVFFLWIFVITFLRIIIFRGIGTNNSGQEMPNICLTGVSEIFIPKDITYSTYILSFTLMYLLMPMIMLSSQSKINVINYVILAFFIFYIAFDLGIKYRLSCIGSLFSGLIIGDILSGLFLGGVIAGPLMYGTALRQYLYINELNSNKEVCSMPSKQQFRCSVYRNGEIIGNI